MPWAVVKAIQAWRESPKAQGHRGWGVLALVGQGRQAPGCKDTQRWDAALGSERSGEEWGYVHTRKVVQARGSRKCGTRHRWPRPHRARGAGS